jgi:(1->4)-alpha-D-glucan 1-alpha-D-glucosylmutase
MLAVHATWRAARLMVQLEDVLGVPDQVNVPGTTDQYPNWRRKLPLELERWPGDERFPALCMAIEAHRPRWEGQRPKLAGRPAPTARIPRATYRLQLNADSASRLPPRSYLYRAGVTTCTARHTCGRGREARTGTTSSTTTRSIPRSAISRRSTSS